MQRFIMLAGPSGSGKSTYGKMLWQDASGVFDLTYLISSDKIREELNGDEADQTDPGRVFNRCRVLMAQRLDEGSSVIFDATNLKAHFREDTLAVARRRGVECELHYMTTTESECVVRMSGRERKVPWDVLDKQFKHRENDLNRPLMEFYTEGFNTIKFVK